MRSRFLQQWHRSSDILAQQYRFRVPKTSQTIRMPFSFDFDKDHFDGPTRNNYCYPWIDPNYDTRSIKSIEAEWKTFERLRNAIQHNHSSIPHPSRTHQQIFFFSPPFSLPSLPPSPSTSPPPPTPQPLTVHPDTSSASRAETRVRGPCPRARQSWCWYWAGREEEG